MHIAYIGLGANQASWAGEPAETLAHAVASLDRLGCVTGKSSLYLTEPVGYADQPRFGNAVVAIETGLEPLDLLHELQKIEKEFGRDRTGAIPNGPRPLDLDLLLFDDRIMNEPELRLPHPRLAERAFVLVPLCEIAPRFAIPPEGVTVAEAMARLADLSGVMRIESAAWRAAGG